MVSINYLSTALIMERMIMCVINIQY